MSYSNPFAHLSGAVRRKPPTLTAPVKVPAVSLEDLQTIAASHAAYMASPLSQPKPALPTAPPSPRTAAPPQSPHPVATAQGILDAAHVRNTGGPPRTVPDPQSLAGLVLRAGRHRRNEE